MTSQSLDNEIFVSIGQFGIGTRDLGTPNSLAAWNTGVQCGLNANTFSHSGWQHIVLTQSGGLMNSSNTKIYINGTYYSEVTSCNGYKNINGSLQIAKHPNLNSLTNATIDEIGIWNKVLTQSEINELYNAGLGLEYSVGETLIELISPINNSNQILSNINFTGYINSTASVGLKNATLNVWHNNGTLFNSTFKIISGSDNATTTQINNFNIGKYKWNIKACSENATGSFCNQQYYNFTFNVQSDVVAINFNATSYETAREYFDINITPFNSLTPTNAYLNYNGTDYSATITANGNNYILSRSIDIPINKGNNTFYFKWNSGGVTEYSLNNTQNIKLILFDSCNSTLYTKFLNLTFKDETSLSVLNASITYSTFQYYLGSGLVNKTITYINNSLNYQYYFCANVNQTFKVNPYIQYKKGTDYPQRTWDSGVVDYTNITTNQILYLLSSTEGIYVTFQVINSAEQPLNDVGINATREISGVSAIVGQGTTGASGTITLWLNPDFIHTFTFSKTGYTPYTTDFAPTNSEYTITLGGTSTTTEYDYSIGISYFILPSSTYLDNNTDYSFNFSISSTYWSLDSYGFTLILNNGSVLGSTSDTNDTGGTINLNVNTMNATSIRMDFYYVVNGSYQNMSRNWIIYDTSDTGFSLWFLINRFKTYMDSGDGIFGLKSNSFGLNLFIYVLILITVGIMSYSFSISSPSAILGMLFGLVALFDVVLGLLYNPPLATAVGVNNFPTILLGIILFGVIIKEAYT